MEDTDTIDFRQVSGSPRRQIENTGTNQPLFGVPEVLVLPLPFCFLRASSEAQNNSLLPLGRPDDKLSP